MSKINKVLDFYADWCGPCQMLKPVIEEVKAEHPEVEFVPVNIDEEQEMAEKYEVMSIPTLVFLDKEDKIVETIIGMCSKPEIEGVLV